MQFSLGYHVCRNTGKSKSSSVLSIAIHYQVCSSITPFWWAVSNCLTIAIVAFWLHLAITQIIETLTNKLKLQHQKPCVLEEENQRWKWGGFDHFKSIYFSIALESIHYIASPHNIWLLVKWAGRALFLKPINNYPHDEAVKLGSAIFTSVYSW